MHTANLGSSFSISLFLSHYVVLDNFMSNSGPLNDCTELVTVRHRRRPPLPTTAYSVVVRTVAASDFPLLFAEKVSIRDRANVPSPSRRQCNITSSISIQWSRNDDDDDDVPPPPLASMSAHSESAREKVTATTEHLFKTILLSIRLVFRVARHRQNEITRRPTGHVITALRLYSSVIRAGYREGNG
ncbi:Hypothetical protein CINCED_3A023536 [Cinara cedri]|uniref:Uncharacterized protein n=1 Tax=Cinara cedri TaxID=506608 RepID=A0A5E4MCQ4_9HEMI|nr:Hypothetical protein CINCED_3A023536 [Cinara cedri]